MFMSSVIVYVVFHNISITLLFIIGELYNKVDARLRKVRKWRGCGIIKVYEFVQTKAKD